jgi:energy-coupling factor transporter ATP-binding protein EcfA2
MGPDGSHLPASLHELARISAVQSAESGGGADRVYAQLANRLSELIDDVYAINVDRDEKRELLTLQVRDRDGTLHPARALSDGTLRFLALAAIEVDSEFHGVLCLEEPENGIHPARIPAMIQLLQDIATDVKEPVGTDNPLRQVIVNTHSPAVVAQVPDDTLVMAEAKNVANNGQPFKKLSFSYLPGTWRAATNEMDLISKGKMLTYLSPVVLAQESILGHEDSSASSRRVIDRKDFHQILLEFGG